MREPAERARGPAGERLLISATIFVRTPGEGTSSNSSAPAAARASTHCDQSTGLAICAAKMAPRIRRARRLSMAPRVSDRSTS